MIKYYDQEKTKLLVENHNDRRGRYVGSPEALIRCRIIEESDLSDVQPWKSLAEWKALLFEESKQLRKQYEEQGIDYLGFNVKCRDKDANAIDVLDRKAEKENYQWPMYYQVNDTQAIPLVEALDYSELQRVMHDRWQKLFHAMGQTNLMIDALTTIEECEAFNVEEVFNGFLP